jgi:hypothetical protein
LPSSDARIGDGFRRERGSSGRARLIADLAKRINSVSSAKPLMEVVVAWRLVDHQPEVMISRSGRAPATTGPVLAH